MAELPRLVTDYDGVWKEILDVLFPQFLKLFCPDIYSEIDWAIEPVSLEKELYKISPEAKVGKRHVDKLFRVRRKKGDNAWVYIHLEFQAQWISNLAERMFVYYSKLFLRYRRPILSLAVLGDDSSNWRPDRFESEIWGNRVTMEFRTIKLWDYRERVKELKQSDNPFAYFVLAHLRTVATQQDPSQRLIDKKAITLDMLESGFNERDIGYLLKFIDAIMTLPEDMEQTYLSRVDEYQEEKNMPIVAPIEEFLIEKIRVKEQKKGREEGLKEGREKGREEGREEGVLSEAQAAVLDNLNDRFSEIPDSLVETIHRIEDLPLLRSLRRHANKVNSLEEMKRLIQQDKK